MPAMQKGGGSAVWIFGGWDMAYNVSVWGAIASLVALIGTFVLKLHRETKALEAKRRADDAIPQVDEGPGA